MEFYILPINTGKKRELKYQMYSALNLSKLSSPYKESIYYWS